MGRQVNEVTDPRALREQLLKLETAMREYAPVEIEIVHHFSPGLYAREARIPKGVLLTGKIHKKAHLNIISQGDISVLTEHGVQRLTAPCTLVSYPGIKRAGFAHEDTVWTTIHATDLTDLEAIEAEFIAKDYAELEALPKEDQVCLGSP